jgi:hypothetical protein
MVHEVQDIAHLFHQRCEIMKPGSQYLLCEPIVHVKKWKYQTMLSLAEKTGLIPVKETKIWLSRSMLFTL